MHIDLRTRVIPENHRVVVGRPGGKYRLHVDFYERNYFGIELPGLYLKGEPLFYNEDDVVSRIQRATAVREWLAKREEGPKPDLNLDSYSNSAKSRSISQLRRVVRFYFETLEAGDILINPPGTLDGNAIIGEVRNRAVQLYFLERYPEFPLVGVPVRWLGLLPKKEIPGKALEALRFPSAFVEIGASRRQKIYAAAYGNYIFRESFNASFSTTSDRYSAYDELILQSFFNAVAINTQKIHAGDGGAVDLSEAAAKVIQGGRKALGEYGLDLTLNVNSPGTISVISNKITPLVAATLFVLAVSVGAAAGPGFENDLVTIGNSLSPDNECAAEVHALVSAHMELLGWHRWVEACEALSSLREHTGLATPAQVE